MNAQYLPPSTESVIKDIDSILWSFRLERIRRYYQQKYWIKESQDAYYADKLEIGLRLETVAEHSWKVADTALMLSDYFPYLDVGRCLRLAVLHDKMEILAGDPSPVGRDGTGMKGHAFNPDKALSKDEREREAISSYIALIRPSIQKQQQSLLLEMLECKSLESRFIKAIDKIEASAFIFLKKGGDIEDKHLLFLSKFHEKNWRIFPPLKGHYDELLDRIFNKVATYRKVTRKTLDAQVFGNFIQEDLVSKALKEEELNWGYETKDGVGSLTKKERLSLLFTSLDSEPPATSSLDAYRQISNLLNNIEDDVLGRDSWNPPRYYPPGENTERLYTIGADSIFPLKEYNGIDVLTSIGEITFISRYGAIEVQLKDKLDNTGNGTDYENRKKAVIYSKVDYQGDGVWHEKNKA